MTVGCSILERAWNFAALAPGILISPKTVGFPELLHPQAGGWQRHWLGEVHYVWLGERARHETNRIKNMTKQKIKTLDPLPCC